MVLATLRGAGGFEKRLVVKQIRDELSFDQQFVRRFVEEAKTTVALSHPNIVPVYELGVEQGTYFLAMELVEGCSIAELVRERNLDGSKRVLSPEEGAYVGMELCRALDYAHRRMKVVHRDITPRNVMLDEEGQVKLIDFGIAAPALVAGHEILGSPGHMPPEQVEGLELGPPTDIFAVAVLLMEAWSGVAAFRRATPEECDEAMRQPHPRPSDYDPRLIPLDDVITRAMKLDPKERQQDAADLARALRAFLQGTDVTDIARELGDRVRDLRQVASEPSPMSLEAGARPPSASVGDLGTKTFAARDDAILHWSRPPAEEIEPPGASTRKLLESRPPSGEIAIAAVAHPSSPTSPGPETPVVLTAARAVNDGRGDETLRRIAPRRPGADDLSLPTPLAVEPVGEGSELLRSAREAQAAARSAERVDTIATRPIETAVPGDAGARAEPSSRRSRPWALIALIGVAAIGVGIAWRAQSNGRTDTAPTSTTSATSLSSGATTPTISSTKATPTPNPSSVASASQSAGPTASQPGIAIAPPGTHGVPSTSAPTTSASASEKQGRALVAFLGDPGTRVSIDGASRGPCPVRVSLEPGQHDVRFQFDPTGESRGERLSVKANEKVTVRAEFTGATPTVRVQR